MWARQRGRARTGGETHVIVVKVKKGEAIDKAIKEKAGEA